MWKDVNEKQLAGCGGKGKEKKEYVEIDIYLSLYKVGIHGELLDYF